MKKRFFVGVDGGGTSSRLQLEDEQGKLLAKIKDGPASIRWSVETSWNSINSAFQQACQQAGIDPSNPDYEFYAGMGLAGCEVDTACAEFLAAPNPFKQIVLDSDGYTACLGAHDNEDGMIITIGTGVVGFVIENNKASSVGGWGFPHDDQGGGAWIGLEAAQYTFQWLDGRREKSALLSAILANFNDDVQAFNNWAVAAGAKEFATLAPIVIRHVEQKEPVAIELMQRAAQHIDFLYKGLLRHQTGSKQLPCSLFGGIAPFVRPYLSAELQKHLVERKHDATKGGVIMIRKAILGHK